MDRRQLGITITAVALALVLGVGITLLATSGSDEQATTTIGGPSTTSSSGASSTSTSTPPATTRPPIVTVPTRPPGTVVIIPPSTTTTRSKQPPRTQPTTTAPPATVAPAATAPPTTTAPTAPVTTVPATTAEPSTTTTTTTATGDTDVGVTATRIRLAVIADDDEVLEGARAWAGVVNRRGGIAGHKLRLDLLPTQGTAEGYAAAMTTACERDFAVVAGLSAFDANTAPLDCGIPDVPIEAIAPAHAARDTTYAAFPRRPGTEAGGPYRYLQSAIAGCCSQYVLVPDAEPARAATDATVAAAAEIGFETIATPEVSLDAPTTDYDALAQDLVASEASFVASGLGRESTIEFRRAAATVGVVGVDAWYCDARCYDRSFLTEGADVVDRQYVAIETVPLGDRRGVRALRTYLVASARNGDDPGYTGLRAYATGLLAEEALRVVVDEHGANGITRARLLDALAGIEGFTAGGIIGPTDIGARAPNGCSVVLQVQDGRFARVHPAERGSLDCGAQNLVEVDD